MAGPGFSILMRYPLTAAQISELDAWLRTFTAHLETHINAAGELDDWFFHVDDVSELGLLDKSESQACMIGLALVEPSREWDGDEEEQTMIKLGFWPRYGINVYAMCKNFATGRITSYLILRLMERYDGYLNACRRERASKRMPVDMVNMLQKQPIPGKNYVIRYWAPDPQYHFYFSCWWEKSIINAERLRWWLKDDESVLPGFYIK